MRSFHEWFNSDLAHVTAPWLILGKGPSFNRLRQFPVSAFKTLSLNHVVTQQPVDVAHIIDLDVVDHCADKLLNNAQVVVMPWFPHVKNRAGAESLDQIASRHVLLSRLVQENRLLWYNLSTASAHRSGMPVTPVRFFSAEAALSLLAMSGVKTVRSLGIDGGSAYSSAFQDLNGTTLLANGRASFDQQFSEIAKIILRTGVDYAPLHLESPIQVFVAATEAQMLAVKVLEYSIKKRTSVTSKVTALHTTGMSIPAPRDPANRARTPFSFQRFLIPRLMGYQGRAIYLDSDMQVFGDLTALWQRPFHGADLLTVGDAGPNRKPQYSVMVLDCAALRWDIDAIVGALDRAELNYSELMFDMKLCNRIKPDIEPEWNSLEHYEEGKTKLLHYTDMETQPWVEADNPLAFLWFRDFFEAVDSGFISEQFIRDEVACGHIRPSIIYQLEHRLEDSLLLPRRALAMDRAFAPAYLTIGGHRSKAGRSIRRALSKVRASFRHNVKESKVGQFNARVIRALLRNH